MIKKIWHKINYEFNTRIIDPIKLRRSLNVEKKIAGGGTAYELNLLLLSHSLEKGMGIESPRKGYGIQKAQSLLKYLSEFAAAENNPKEFYAYNEGMSVLGKYIEYTEDSGVNVADLKENFSALAMRHPYSVLPAGYEIYNPYDYYQSFNYREIEGFITSRHSVRSYIPKSVESCVVESAIQLASHFPSACNRQPIKVFWTNKSAVVARVGGYIPGNKGFEGQIPNWAFITADRQMFGSGELLQWYVNGGIFASYFVLALHANGIASCIFQIPISWEHLEDIRNVAGIPDQYAIVCAVGFGYPKETVKRIMASRKPVNDFSVPF